MEALAFSIGAEVPEDDIAAISEEAARAGITVQIERREGGAYASLWLYVPTLVAIFLAKPFFEAILKKAGEDCYPHLKQALAQIVMLLSARKPLIIGKQPDEKSKRYSLMVSFYFEIDEDRRAKFLIRNDVSEAAYQECVDRMCDLLMEHVTSGTGDLVTIASRAPSKRLLLLDFDFDSHKWDLYNESGTP